MSDGFTPDSILNGYGLLDLNRMYVSFTPNQVDDPMLCAVWVLYEVVSSQMWLTIRLLTSASEHTHIKSIVYRSIDT